MKKSTILFEIELDGQNVPEKITWQASDNPEGDKPKNTKSASIALWDHDTKQTLRIDVWSKDMPVDEMKKYYVDMIGGLAQSVMNATGDEFMSNEMKRLCDTFVDYLNQKKEST